MNGPEPAGIQSYPWRFLLPVCVLLIAVLCIFVPRSAPSSDSLEYFKMANGEASSVGSPYRYRILAPLVARAMPGPIPQRFAAITMIALAGTLVVFCLIAMQQGIAWPHATVGLAIICGCPAFNFMLLNPWLTDAAGIFFLTLMARSLLVGDKVHFSIAGLLGLLTRESVAFLFPSSLALGGLLPWIACILGAALFLLPRFLFHGIHQSYLGHTGWALGGITLARWLELFIASWGVAWTVFFYWFAALRWNRVEDRRSIIACAWLLLGAFFSSYKNTDAIRMFEILAPVVFVGCAASLQSLWRSSKTVYAVLLLCFAIEAGVGSFLFGWHWRRFPIINILAILVATLTLAAHAFASYRRGPAESFEDQNIDPLLSGN